MNSLFSKKVRIIVVALVALCYFIGLYLFKYFSLGEVSQFNFAFSYIFVYLVGGLYGIFAAKKIGLNSTVGKFLLYGGIGILGTAIGEIIWDYHQFVLGIEVPYPSIADIFYLSTTLFIAFGLVYLLRVYQIKVKKTAVSLGALIFIVLTAISASVQGMEAFSIEENGVAGVIFNLLYTVNDTFTLAVAFIVLVLAGGKLLKGLSAFVFGFILFATANVVFYVQAVIFDRYYSGGVTDMLYLVAGLLMGIGLIIAANKLSSRTN